MTDQRERDVAVNKREIKTKFWSENIEGKGLLYDCYAIL